jgi:hypothetical protein
MQKQILERFITKYTLGGMIEILPWKSDGSRTTIQVGAENNMVVVHLSCSELQLPEGEYCIYETAQLRSLINILNDEISLNVKVIKEKPAAFTLTDDSTVVDFALADPLAMPKKRMVLDTSQMRDDMWNATFEADTKFTGSFMRAKSALNVEDFTVKGSASAVQLILGYADYGNSTRVTLSPISPTINNKFSTLKFSANCLREIFAANKEANARISVSEDGLMWVHYQIEGFDVDYYLTMKAD